MRSIRLLLPLLAAAMVLVFATPGAAAPQTPAATFVGSDMCAACHSETAEHLAATPHGKKAFAALAAQGCESCHGPGSAHAEDPENPALYPLITRLTPK